MDLIERPPPTQARHPWETARAEVVRSLIARLDLKAPRVLDVGCGDGFLIDTLREQLHFREAVAQDIHLTPAIVAELGRQQVEFVQELAQIAGRRFDLLLLLDVLEHVPDPLSLLTRLLDDHLVPDGWVVITVPAFQSLFSQHDRALRHERRYSRPEICALVEQAGLRVLDSGYFFASLLLPRALSKLRQLVIPPTEEPVVESAGWNGPKWLARALHQVLHTDNQLCLKAQQKGLVVPGLSAWVVCSRPRS